MVTRLEEIRTIATGDASSYEAMAKKVEASSRAMDAAVAGAGATVEQSERKFAASSRGLNRLVSELDPAAKAVQRFEAGQTLLARALDSGKISLDRHGELISRLRERYGSVSQALTVVGGATQAPARGLTVLATAAEHAEGRFKTGVRTLNDVRGTLELLGPATARAAGGLGTVAATVGNVSDAFGVLALVLSRHPILAIVTVAAAAAATAYLYLSETTDKATKAQEAYAEALKTTSGIERDAAASARELARERLALENATQANAESRLQALIRDLEKMRAAARQDLDEQEAQGIAGYSRPEEIEPYRAALAALDTQLELARGKLLEVRQLMAQNTNAVADLGRAAQLTAKDHADLLDAQEKAWTPAVHPDLKRREEVLRSLASTTETYGEEVRKLGNDLRSGTIGPAEYARALENLQSWLYETGQEFERTREAAKGLKEAQEETLKESIAAEQKKLNSLYQAAEKVISETATSTERYGREVAVLDDLLRQGFITQDQYARKVEQLNNELHQADPAFAAAREAASKYAKELERVVDRTTDRIIDFGADALFDYLEGRREDFWAGMVTTAKRAFAQMVAEAALRPIIMPVVQSVVGAVPQAFGLQQQGGSAMSLMNTAGQAKSAFDFLSNPFGSLSNLFSPDNFIAGMFPSLFGSGISAGGMLASTLTGPGGLMLGGGVQSAAMLGAGPLAALAPMLPVLAIALPLLLSSIFGGKESVGANGNAIVNFERNASGRLTSPGGLAIGGLGSDNGGDTSIPQKMAEAATKGFNAILDRLGARLTGFSGAGQSGQTELYYFEKTGKYGSQVGGEKAEFGSAEEAVADFIRRSLTHGTIEGLSENVRTALRNTDATDLEQLGADIDFADRFGDAIALMNAGLGTLSEQALRFRLAADEAGEAEARRIQDFLESTDRLYPGADGAQSANQAAARTTLRADLLGRVGLRQAGPGFERIPALDDGAKPLSGWAARMAETEAQIRGLVPAFEAAGFAATQIAEIVPAAIAKARDDLKTDFEKGLDDTLLSAKGQGYLIELGDLQDAYEQAVTDAAALGADLTKVEDTYGQLRLNALEKFTGEQLDAADAYYRTHGLMTADLQAEIDAIRTKTRNDFDRDMGDRLLAAQGQGHVVDLRQLEADRTKALEEAQRLGADLAQVEHAYSQLRLNALDKFSFEQLQAAEAYYRDHGLLTQALQAQIDQAYARIRARADAEAASAMGSIYANAEQRRVDALEQARQSAWQTQVDANAELIRQQTELASTAEQAAREFGQLEESLGDTLLGLRVRNGTPTQRLDILQGEFRRLMTLARTGDKDALGRVGAAGEAYEQQARRYFGGGAGYAPIGQEIEQGLTEARAMAALQKSVAESQLAEAQRQVRLLEEIRDRLGPSPGSGAARVGGGDFDSLAQAVQQFVGAKASMGLAEGQIRQLPEWSYFEAQRREIIGRITDTSYLVNALYRYYGGRREADAMGDTGAPEIVARLHALGVPGFASGTGPYGRTGLLARVHADELLYTGPPARVFNAAESAVLMSGQAGRMAGLDELIAAVKAGTAVQAQSTLALQRTIAEQSAELGDMASAMRRASVGS